MPQPATSDIGMSETVTSKTDLEKGSRIDPITLAAALLGLFALLPTGEPWLLLKANRLVAGDVYGAFSFFGPYAYALLGVWALLLLLSFVRFAGRAWVLALLCAAVLA